jgi:hypothetical protein
MQAKERKPSIPNLKIAGSIGSLCCNDFGYSVCSRCSVGSSHYEVLLGFLVAFLAASITLSKMPNGKIEKAKAILDRFQMLDLLLAFTMTAAGLTALYLHGLEWSLVFATLLFVLCGIYWLYQSFKRPNT